MTKSYDLSALAGKLVPLAIEEHYAQSFLMAEAQAAAKLATGELPVPAVSSASAYAYASSNEDEDEGPESPLLQMLPGATAIVTIKGQLTNRDNRWNSYFGLVSYNEIRAAIVEAIDLGANSILFDADSPGGAVAGMKDLAEFIQSLEVPTVFYTASTMASAMLFLGISGDHVLAGDMSEVGSVGVVMTLIEYSKMLTEAGYKATVIRSGNLKQVGNPTEPLTPEAEAYLTDQVMIYANKFFDFVTTRRKHCSEDMKSGRTYIGEHAQTAGLVDRITTFDEALAFTLYLGANYLDKKNNLGQAQPNRSQTFNLSGENNMKKTFSTQAMAALAAGAIPSAEESEVKDTQAVDTAGQAQQDEPTAEVLVMQERIKQLQASLEVATSALETAQAEFEAAKAAVKSADALKALVIDQVTLMRNALALVTVDMSAFTPEAILAEHASVAQAFAKSFPVGGVVPDATAQDKTKQQPVVLDRELAQAVTALGF